MSAALDFPKFDCEQVCRDFEIQGWTRFAPSDAVKKLYFDFLKYSQQFLERDPEQNSHLVNPHGLVFPGYMTYPGGRDGYFQDTTYMFHVSLYEEEQAGPGKIKSLTRYANIWPEFPEFRDTFIEMRNYFFGLATRTLKAVEEYYDLPDGDLVNMVDNGWSMQRAMMYKPFLDKSRIGSLTVGEHRDSSMLTLTFGGSQPGLEIKNDAGEWEAIDGQEADIVIGSGGMLEQITNGNFKNMFHRVKYVDETVDNTRISSPFFCWPKPESILEPHEKIMQQHNQRPRFPSQLTIRHLEQNLMVPFSFPEDQDYLDNYFNQVRKAG